MERQLRRNAERANVYKDASNQYVGKVFAVEVKEAVNGIDCLITQSSKRTRKQQNAVLFFMLQPMMSMRYLSMTVSCQSQHSNLT